MKVILTKRVPALGNIGELVNVSQGHARNFLIPGGFAVWADASSLKQVENQQKQLAKKMAEEKNAAVEVKKKIENTKLELVRRVGANGKLFGAITNTELSKELATRGLDVERRLISVVPPIKALGSHDIKVKLFSGVEAILKVKIVIDPVQAEELKAREAAAKKAKQRKAEAGEAVEAAATEAVEGESEE
jgi:large subunit ribosomal protein L9